MMRMTRDSERAHLACAAPTRPAKERDRSMVSPSAASMRPGLLPQPIPARDSSASTGCSQSRTHSRPAHLRGWHRPGAPVSGQEPDVLRHHRIRARPHLVRPAVPFRQLAWLGKALGCPRVCSRHQTVPPWDRRPRKVEPLLKKPGFAHRVLMIIRNCSRIQGSYTASV